MKKAGIFILVMIVSIVVFDAYLIIGEGTDASISNQIIEWSYEFPAFTFLVGFAMGHLFWVISNRKKQ
jgi:hypothetical protein